MGTTTETMRDTSTLVVKTCGKCGIRFAIPQYFDQENFENKRGWHCPNGHSRVYRETEAGRLRKELANSKRDTSYWLERSREEERTVRNVRRSNRALKGVVTRTKNRISNGVCPCCNRTFKALARHMTTKHPDYYTPTRSDSGSRRK